MVRFIHNLLPNLPREAVIEGYFQQHQFIYQLRVLNYRFPVAQIYPADLLESSWKMKKYGQYVKGGGRKKIPAETGIQ
jgi:hypothetical protein